MSKPSTPSPVPPTLAARLRRLAARYETPAFAEADPIGCLRFCPPAELETAAFVAASLSYGSRTQFIPKIHSLLAQTRPTLRSWILSSSYTAIFPPNDTRSYYRLFTRAHMHAFFTELRTILLRHGTLSGYLQSVGATTAPSAVRSICSAFGGRAAPVIPKDATSACKRLCMFLRWMARDNSPVDYGIWSPWLDKRTLLIPLDIHVLRQANRLGLIHTQSPTMRTAERLTAKLQTVFPDDPCKADFALYGLGTA
jgi:uncharacterized protein (TIGR02757 family)